MVASDLELGQRCRYLLLHKGKVMRAMQPASVSPVVDKAVPALPETFLSCYEIVNADGLRWHVRLYRVRRMAGAWQSHEERREIKQAVWTLRKKYQGLCRGYGFVVDVGQELVAVPAEWNLSSRTRNPVSVRLFGQE